MEGLSNLRNLRSLWLGKNKIEKIEGIGGLTSLKQVDVQSNRLTAVSGIDTLSELEELYLASNAIDSIAGIPQAGTLTTIDLSRNKLSSLAGIEVQTSLEDLWLSTNLFSTFDFLDHTKKLSKLTTIYLEHNPIASDFEYRLRVSAAMPGLEFIDATMTTAGRQRPLVSYGTTSAAAVVAPPGSTI